MSKKDMINYLKTQGYNLWLWKTRSHTKLIDKNNKWINFKWKIENEYYLLDDSRIEYKESNVFLSDFVDYVKWLKTIDELMKKRKFADRIRQKLIYDYDKQKYIPYNFLND